MEVGAPGKTPETKLPAESTRILKAYPDRPYDLLLPADRSQPMPLLLILHGGGGQRAVAARITCPEGEIDSPKCLHKRALATGYAVVLPDGTGARLVKKMRTWNAGGRPDSDRWRCTSGRACKENVDDIAYFRVLLADIKTMVRIDNKRVYATGISNGGAMSYRLACELSEQITAIAAVGGAMQLTTHDKCEPGRGIPVLHIHGTEDPCWRYEGGIPDCPTGQKGLAHVPVSRTIQEWRTINGCDESPVISALPDTADDGTVTKRHTYQNCKADLVLLEIEGAGHTWPQGWPYRRERIIGKVPQDWGNEVILEFFGRQTSH
jgi:polyhydroxybutyrate depolymerase